MLAAGAGSGKCRDGPKAAAPVPVIGAAEIAAINAGHLPRGVDPAALSRWGLALAPAGVSSKLGELLGWHDVHVGDAAFDNTTASGR